MKEAVLFFNDEFGRMVPVYSAKGKTLDDAWSKARQQAENLKSLDFTKNEKRNYYIIEKL